MVEADASTVDDAVAAARAALRGPWGRMGERERAEVLRRVADELERRFDDLVAAEVADTGKSISQARTLDIPRGAANFRAFAEIVATAPTESFTTVTPTGGRALNYAVRKPVGVVAIIVPWNLPLLLLTWKVAPALACGNAVVVKPSEETPASATLLAEVMAAAGVPDGRVQPGARLRPGLGRRVPHPAPGRRRDHLHRRVGHRQRHHAGRRRRGEGGLLRAGRQERRAGLRRRRPGRGGRRLGAVQLHQRRSGLPLHRADLRAAPGLRGVRRPAGEAGRTSWRTAGRPTRRRSTCR